MPKLLEQVSDLMRRRHYSPRTEQTYLHWMRQFIFFTNKLTLRGELNRVQFS